MIACCRLETFLVETCCRMLKSFLFPLPLLSTSLLNMYCVEKLSDCYHGSFLRALCPPTQFVVSVPTGPPSRCVRAGPSPSSLPLPARVDTHCARVVGGTHRREGDGTHAAQSTSLGPQQVCEICVVSALSMPVRCALILSTSMRKSLAHPPTIHHRCLLCVVPPCQFPLPITSRLLSVL